MAKIRRFSCLVTNKRAIYRWASGPHNSESYTPGASQPAWGPRSIVWGSQGIGTKNARRAKHLLCGVWTAVHALRERLGRGGRGGLVPHEFPHLGFDCAG